MDELLHAAMKEWLLDCFEDEYDQEQINELDHSDTLRAVNRYYDGGVEAFMSQYIEDSKIQWI